MNVLVALLAAHVVASGAAPTPAAATPAASPAASPLPCSADGWCVEAVPVPDGTEIHAIRATADGDVWIGGDHGVLMRRDHADGAWRRIDAGLGDRAIVTSIYAGKDAVWLAAGDLWKSADGTHFEKVIFAPHEDGQFDADATLLWGDGGAPFIAGKRPFACLWVPGGKGWKPFMKEVGARVNTIDGSSRSDVWVGGDEGLLLHWDGKTVHDGVLAGAHEDCDHKKGACEADDEAFTSIRGHFAAFTATPRRRGRDGVWRPWKGLPRDACFPGLLDGPSDRDLWFLKAAVAGVEDVCHFDGTHYRREHLPIALFPSAISVGPDAVWLVDSGQPTVLRRPLRRAAK